MTGSTGGAGPFPGGTSISHLRVYDWPAPDGHGLAGSGTPHLHLASSEAYVVLAGAGGVQTLGPQGFAEIALTAGTVAWFTPGVVHRLVNDGGLELLVIMSNAGLPEAGDAVLTFPADVLADGAAYRAAAALPAPGTDTEDDDVVAAAVRTRRDLALTGFSTLRERVAGEGPAGLAELYAAAGRLGAELAPRFQEIWSADVRPQAAATEQALADLALGLAPQLARASWGAAVPRPGPRRYGMCGRLQTWPI